MPQPETGKLDYLESVRGLAALTVIFSHLVLAFYPDMKTGGPMAGQSSFLVTMAQSPLMVLHDGHFSVRVFSC